MKKRVLDVGNCSLDHGSITQLIQSNFDAVVELAAGGEEALQLLERNDYALVLVNRLLDTDGSSGLDLIKNIKTRSADIPVMMITNFAEHQDAAVADGAIRGFGKSSLSDITTIDLLREYLE